MDEHSADLGFSEGHQGLGHGVDVRLSCGMRAPQSFRCSKTGRQSPSGSLGASIEQSGHPKVRDDGIPCIVEEDVVRRNIAVYDIDSMGLGKRDEQHSDH